MLTLLPGSMYSLILFEHQTQLSVMDIKHSIDTPPASLHSKPFSLFPGNSNKVQSRYRSTPDVGPGVNTEYTMSWHSPRPVSSFGVSLNRYNRRAKSSGPMNRVRMSELYVWSHISSIHLPGFADRQLPDPMKLPNPLWCVRVFLGISLIKGFNWKSS